MGTVIRFPDEKRLSWNGAAARTLDAPASIVILPVVRIERHAEEPLGGWAPGTGTPPGPGRHRPGRRS